MPTQQPKAAIAAIEEPLLKAYAQAWEQILEMQERVVLDPVRWRQRRRLEEMRKAIEAAMDQLDATTRLWVQTELVRPYALGAAAGATELAESAAAVWSQLPKDAISRMATDTLADLLKSTRHVRRTTKSMIRAVARDEILRKLIIGDTAEAAGRRVEKLLLTRGISAITYSDGSRHGLKEYAQVLVRTKTAEAYNLGSLQAQDALGIGFWECFDGARCGWTSHNDGDRALGKIVTRDEALAFPISHPQCRRSFGARPDILSKKMADALTPSVTPEQIAAGLAADVERSRAQAASRYRSRRMSAPRPAPRARANAGASIAAAKRGDTRVSLRRTRSRRKAR
jgi:hypothetical protein